MFFFCSADNDLNPRLKNAQQDVNTDGIAQANQNLPQAQADQSLECDSNNIETVAQESSNTSTSGEVSSSRDQPVSTTSGVSSSVNYSDSDDADDCPVFEYSAESMQVAKDSNDSPETTSKEVEPSAEDTMENDEDLVQLDDDEHFGNETGISEEHVNQTQADNSQNIESPVASPETTTNTGTECSEPAPSNNECESSESAPLQSNQEKETEDVSESEDHIAESSEAQPSTPDALEKDVNGKNGKTKAGIEGMDTEMISEDEHELHDDASKENKADKENNNRKSDRDDSFKKVSKSNKDRNYRDKKEKSDNKSRNRRSKSRSIRRSRSRSSRRSRSNRRSKSSSLSRSRSRSKSRNRSRRGAGKRTRRKDNREKRQELQRYNVRTVIADRQPKNHKDKYGRDESRPKSVSPRRVKSKSRSRSVSPG